MGKIIITSDIFGKAMNLQKNNKNNDNTNVIFQFRNNKLTKRIRNGGNITIVINVPLGCDQAGALSKSGRLVPIAAAITAPKNNTYITKSI